MSTTDPGAIRALKRILPRNAKHVAEAGIRASTTTTARWRPAPDFLVIGTKRGGTTTLWEALSSHPQVQPMVPVAKHLKSPHYFYRHYDRGPEWYRGHFPTTFSRARHRRIHGKSVVGEASPMYLFDPRVPARVAELTPEVKIVVTLRDPVQRAVSHWAERIKEGHETLSFEDALAAEPERLAGEWNRVLAEPNYYSRALDWYSYRTRGEYASQLERWFEFIDPARIHVLRAEDLYSDQKVTLQRVFDFLDIDAHDLPSRWRNRTQHDAVPISVKRELAEHFAPHNHKLAQLLGTADWWPTVGSEHIRSHT